MYKCLRCGKTFRDKWGMNRHFKREKLCKKNILDVTYKEMIENYDYLLEFLEIEGVINNKVSMGYPENAKKMEKTCEKVEKGEKYKCNYCSMVFTKKNNLYRHRKHRCKIKKIKEKNMKCKYCGKQYKHKSSLSRHMKKCKDYCESDEESSFDESDIEEKKEIKIINNYYNNINNINNFNYTQNIIVKDYGKEDISYITNEFLNKMIKGPFASIQRTNNMIHFNKEHPENMNVKITNKKEPFVKVYKKNKWCVENKDKIIKGMIDKAMTLIDEYYATEGKESLPKSKNNTYLRFQKAYNTSDSFKRRLHEEIEIMIINNGLSV